MALTTRLTTLLGIRHPVLLAPMDPVAGARLTRAVSDAGGFGFLAGGYGNPERLEGELRKLEDSPPFGVGFITWSLARRPELLDLVLAAKPRAVLLSFGDPTPFARPIKDAGALLICQVQSESMARQALDAGADVLVAQGAEAGGHAAERSTLPLVPAIVDLAAGSVPVVAAGGIADGRGLAAALALGADGALIGTRFYAAEEADGASEAKQRICAASGDETLRGLIFDIALRQLWPGPFTGRCLTNDFSRQWSGRELALSQDDDAAAAYQSARAAKNYDIAGIAAGEAAGLIRNVQTAAEIVETIAAQAERILLDLAARL